MRASSAAVSRICDSSAASTSSSVTLLVYLAKYGAYSAGSGRPTFVIKRIIIVLALALVAKQNARSPLTYGERPRASGGRARPAAFVFAPIAVRARCAHTAGGNQRCGPGPPAGGAPVISRASAECALPQRRFDRGVERRVRAHQRADAAPDDLALAVDQHRRRQHRRLQQVRDLAARVERDRIADGLILHERLHRRGALLVDADADDFEAARRVLRVHLLELRDLEAAGAAPGCPEVEEDDVLAARGGE